MVDLLHRLLNKRWCVDVTRLLNPSLSLTSCHRPVQAADRALLVDLLPPSGQEVGNAWAGRMFGLGSVAGFFMCVLNSPWDLSSLIIFLSGNVDLTKTFPFLGKTQLQVLSVLTSLSLMGAHGVTLASVSEKVLLKDTSQCVHERAQFDISLPIACEIAMAVQVSSISSKISGAISSPFLPLSSRS